MSIESLRLRCPHCQEKFHVDLRGTEDLEAKPESGTADCSAAGGDVEQEQAGRSADWQACWAQLVAIMDNRRKQIVDAIDDGMCHLPNKAVAEEYRILLEKANAIEERRRSEERT